MRKAGVEMDVQTDGAGLCFIAHDLTLETEMDTEDNGRMTVTEVLEAGITEKLRCQTPFRESNSFAAFLGFGADGTPFIYDSGTGITHWLNEFEAEKLPQIQTEGVVQRLMRELEKGDCGAPLEPEAVRALVPKPFVTAVSPFVWHKEYFVAALAGARLNVVGELPDDAPIPAAMFKTVTGGDLITGRHPTHRPITFKNEAAHLFMSNHLINTRDHSEAFFSRWLIVEFPNSRLCSGLPIDPKLADRIIANELPGIAQWALDGAVRLMRNGSFSKSAAHDRLMAQWRRSTSSLEEFIHECCELGSELSARRSSLYQEYADWCKENGRHPFSKSRVRNLLDHNVGLGISRVERNGHETFRGIQIKSATQFTVSGVRYR